MKISRLSIVGLAFALSAPVAMCAAQSQFVYHIGGGGTMPSGDLGTYANTGWNGFAGIGKAMASNPNLMLQATAFYAHVSHDGTSGEATNIPGVGVGALYRLGTGNIHPYVSGQVGFLQHRYDAGTSEYAYGSESETKGFLGVGGGLAINRVFVDARYIAASGTSFIPISVGVTLGGRTK